MVGDFGWEHEGTKSGVGTVNIYQDILKSANLLHKKGFVDSQPWNIVHGQNLYMHCDAAL